MSGRIGEGRKGSLVMGKVRPGCANLGLGKIENKRCCCDPVVRAGWYGEQET